MIESSQLLDAKRFEMVDLLLQYGADPNVGSPLLSVGIMTRCPLRAENYMPIFHRHGLRIDGDIFIHLIDIEARAHRIQILRRLGIRISARSMVNALRNPSALEDFLVFGGDPNAVDDDSEMSLLRLARRSAAPAMTTSVLLKHGADEHELQ